MDFREFKSENYEFEYSKNLTECRFCLQTLECPYTIEDRIQNEYIWAIINNLANISISTVDLFPQGVCNGCYEKLVFSYQFLLEVKNSDEFLHKKDFECITIIKEEPQIDSFTYDSISNQPRIEKPIQDETKKISIQKKKIKIPSKKSNKSNSQIFTCCLCHTRVFEDEPSLLAHTKLVHIDKIEKNASAVYPTENTHECKYCKRKFRLRESLKNHIKHPKFIEPKSQMDNPKFIEPKQNHSSDVNEKYKNTRNVPSMCTECGLVFGDRKTLRNHELRIHAKDFPAVCPFPGCGKRFAADIIVKRHMSVHGEKKHICDTCGKGFVRAQSLKSHRFLHQDIKQFTCDLCSRTFTYKTMLKRHIESHIQEKVFRCDQCEKTYKWEGDLKSHIKGVHLDDPPYKCRYCNKGYFCSSSKKYHEQRCLVRDLN